MARNIVSRILPQRSVASRILPQRSIVSRITPQRAANCRNSGGCGCGCSLKNGAASYFWADLFDNTFTLKKNTPVYNSPFAGGYILRWLPAGSPIFLYSYVNAQGKTWLLVYPVNYGFVDNTRMFSIPLTGPVAGEYTIPVQTFNSLFDPKTDNPTIQTDEEKEQTENPPDITDRVLSGLKTIAVFGVGAYLLGKFIGR